MILAFELVTMMASILCTFGVVTLMMLLFGIAGVIFAILVQDRNMTNGPEYWINHLGNPFRTKHGVIIMKRQLDMR